MHRLNILKNMNKYSNSHIKSIAKYISKQKIHGQGALEKEGNIRRKLIYFSI